MLFSFRDSKEWLVSTRKSRDQRLVNYRDWILELLETRLVTIYVLKWEEGTVIRRIGRFGNKHSERLSLAFGGGPDFDFLVRQYMDEGTMFADRCEGENPSFRRIDQLTDPDLLRWQAREPCFLTWREGKEVLAWIMTHIERP